MRARDIMSSPAVTVHRATPIGQAARTLRGYGFRALPVVDDAGSLVGIVTEHDLTVRFAGATPAPRPGNSVAEVMTSSVIAIPAGTDVGQLAAAMVNLQLRSLPIVDGRTVVGVVTRRDLVRTLAQATLA